MIVKGKCHICEAKLPIQFCGMCGHWMCDECRSSWGKRIWAAAKEKLTIPSRKSASCCGPVQLER